MITCVCARVHLHVCVRVSVITRVCACVHECVCMCVHVSMHERVCVRVNTGVHVSVYDRMPVFPCLQKSPGWEGGAPL